MDNGVSNSTLLETTIKHLTKEISLGSRAEHNLVRIGQNIEAEISLMEKLPWSQWEFAQYIIQEKKNW